MINGFEMNTLKDNSIQAKKDAIKEELDRLSPPKYHVRKDNKEIAVDK